METTDSRIDKFRGFMNRALYAWETEKMLDILSTRGFFTAPASTNYHSNYEGGLFDHSYAVATNLVNLTKRLNLKWEKKRSPYVVGMLHDLCKMDRYILKEDGYHVAKGQLLDGHGSLSVILAQQICDFPLTNEEILCIRWHMGAFDEKENWKYFSQSVEIYPNVLYTHMADMIASHIQEV